MVRKVRKYSVECPFPNCGKPFTNKARYRAIGSMKTHAKRKHGVDYMVEDVEYRIREFMETESDCT